MALIDQASENKVKVVLVRPMIAGTRFFSREMYLTPELYDLVEDPHERTDLAAAHPDPVHRMLGELEAWFEEVEADARAGGGRNQRDRRRSRLCKASRAEAEGTGRRPVRPRRAASMPPRRRSRDPVIGRRAYSPT